MARGQFVHQFGLFQGHGAEDHPIQTAGQQFFGPFGAAHAPAQLHGDGEGGGNCLDRGVVGRLAAPGAIEIHQVQPPGTLLLPAEGLGHGVVAEAGYLLVVTLVQPHALAVEQIDGGDHLHGGGQGQ